MTSSPTERLQALKTELEDKEAELAEMRAAMPKHTVRVHQQMALEDAEDEVRRLRAEIASLEGAAGTSA